MIIFKYFQINVKDLSLICKNQLILFPETFSLNDNKNLLTRPNITNTPPRIAHNYIEYIKCWLYLHLLEILRNHATILLSSLLLVQSHTSLRLQGNVKFMWPNHIYLVVHYLWVVIDRVTICAVLIVLDLIYEHMWN